MIEIYYIVGSFRTAFTCPDKLIIVTHIDLTYF